MTMPTPHIGVMKELRNMNQVSIDKIGDAARDLEEARKLLEEARPLVMLKLSVELFEILIHVAILSGRLRAIQATITAGE